MSEFFNSLSKILPVSLNGVSAPEYKTQQTELTEKKKNPLDFDGMGNTFAQTLNNAFPSFGTNNAGYGASGD